MKILAASFLFSLLVWAGGLPDVITSPRVGGDFQLTADAQAPQWKDAPGVFAENDARGKPTTGHRTEIRSRWTAKYLYFLFICPYEELNLKPDLVTTAETNKLWNWDVAEVFVGADFSDITHYREFEVSPQGEWIDLDIHSEHLDGDKDRVWESGFQVKARIDRQRKVWYGEMKIPLSSIDRRPAKAGNELRINFYRAQGPAPARKLIAWRPTQAATFHVPEAFGRLVLGE